MGLFSSIEEKEQKKSEKKMKSFQQLVDKYNLNDMSEEDFNLIKNISDKLTGTGFLEMGVALSLNTKPEDQIKINRLSALQEQNWIIINQLGRLNKNVKELIDLNKK